MISFSIKNKLIRSPIHYLALLLFGLTSCSIFDGENKRTLKSVCSVKESFNNEFQCNSVQGVVLSRESFCRKGLIIYMLYDIGDSSGSYNLKTSYIDPDTGFADVPELVGQNATFPYEIDPNYENYTGGTEITVNYSCEGNTPPLIIHLK